LSGQLCQLLFVRKIIWGTQVGAPNLMNVLSYISYNPSATLNYIIAPGAGVSDVSEGANESDGAIIGTTLVLQPNGDFTDPQYAFAPGDDIEQAIGAQPWNPVGFRSRHFNNIPSLMPEASFEGINWGTAAVGVGFRTHGVDGIKAAAKRYPRGGGVAFQVGIMLGASMNQGIVLQGDVSVDSNHNLLGTSVHDHGFGLCFMQLGRDFDPAAKFNKKAIVWSALNKLDQEVFAALGFDPATLEYYLRGGRVRVEGLAASTTGPSHLRGIAVPVAAQAMIHVVQLDPSITEPDNNYAIQVTPSWITQLAVTNKTTTTFSVQFGTPAPAGASIDWFLVR
jgi:hypothetical protein